MDESKGHLCPECGAPRGADNTPSCACTQRASDALRDTRTAEAAAAEDFDPLRIRPYVELEAAAEGDGGDGGDKTDPDRPTHEGPAGDAAAAQSAAETPAGDGTARPARNAFGRPDVRDVPDVEATMALRPVTQGPAPANPGASAEDATVTLPAVDATTALPVPPATDAASALPTPLARPATTPSPADLHLFEAADGHGPADTDDDEKPSRRRRRTVVLAAGAAVVSVVAAAGIASGLFSYETPSRDEAPPEGVRAAVPDASTSAASVSPSAPTSSAAPTSASPSASASASPSPTSSPSASASSASPSPSRSTAEPTISGPTSTADESDNSREASPPVLRRGSEGSEVTELELRLTQLGLYTRKASGHYNEGVEDAVTQYQWTRGIQTKEYGVYDLVTRKRLESETAEP